MADREKAWRFQCPECGFGDVELAGLATDDELHCVVCWEERRVAVTLCRWLDETVPASQARLRGGLAA